MLRIMFYRVQSQLITVSILYTSVINDTGIYYSLLFAINVFNIRPKLTTNKSFILANKGVHKFWQNKSVLKGCPIIIIH